MNIKEKALRCIRDLERSLGRPLEDFPQEDLRRHLSFEMHPATRAECLKDFDPSSFLSIDFCNNYEMCFGIRLEKNANLLFGDVRLVFAVKN